MLYEGDNGYCALVAEVEVDQDSGAIVVKRFVAAMDSGPVSNPDRFRNQTEGGAMQGMSRALFEEVRWNNQRLTTSDWRGYPVFRFGDFVPAFETVLIDRKDAPQNGGRGVLDNAVCFGDRQRGLPCDGCPSAAGTVHFGSGTGR